MRRDRIVEGDLNVPCGDVLLCVEPTFRPDVGRKKCQDDLSMMLSSPTGSNALDSWDVRCSLVAVVVEYGGT